MCGRKYGTTRTLNNFPVISAAFRKSVEQRTTNHYIQVRDSQYLQELVKLIGHSVAAVTSQNVQGEAVDETPRQTNEDHQRRDQVHGASVLPYTSFRDRSKLITWNFAAI